jgi:hypothetical protein
MERAMNWPIALPIIALMVLGVGFFAVKGWKNARRLAALKPSAAKLEAGLDNPELDEKFPEQVAFDQQARDKAAV